MSDETLELDPKRVVENGLVVNLVDIAGYDEGDEVTLTEDNLLLQTVVELEVDDVLTADQITEALLSVAAAGRKHPRLQEAGEMGIAARYSHLGDGGSASMAVPFTGDDGYDSAIEDGRFVEAMTGFGVEGAAAHEAVVNGPNIADEIRALLGELGIDAQDVAFDNSDLPSEVTTDDTTEYPPESFGGC